MKWYRRLVLPLLVACLMAAGCGLSKPEAPAQPTPTPTPTPIIKEQSFVVYRSSVAGLDYLLPEKYVIKDNGKPIAENALRTLVETKPQDSKLESMFPDGTTVLGLKVKDSIAYADFSKHLLKIGGGSYTELMLTGAVVNTLTEFPEIKKVQILVEGKKIDTLNGHLDLADPLERNVSLLAEGQKGKKKN